MTQKEAWDKYKATKKGKAAIKRYQQSEKYKASQKKYHQTEKYKKLVRDHPEIYKPTKERRLSRDLGKILYEHELDTKDDPERLTPEFICQMAHIEILGSHKPPVGLHKK